MDRHISTGLHDFLWCLRRSSWIFPVALIAFLLLIPFSTAGIPGDSIFNIEVTHDQLKFRLFEDGAIWPIIAASLGLGLCAGLSLFRSVHIKKETTIFFSLGITRTRLFLDRTLAGVLLIVGSIAIPMVVSLGLNCRALGLYEGLIRNTLYLTAGLILLALISFFLTAAVAFVSGTTAETVVYWAGLISCPTILCYGAGLLLQKLYWGNAWGVITYSGVQEVLPSPFESLSFLNPITFFYEELADHGHFMRPMTSATPEPITSKVLLGWSIVCILLGALAWLLLRRRPAEDAGVAGTNKVLSEIIIVLTAFLVFSLAFSFLYASSVWLAICLGILAFAAVHLFWRCTLFSYQFRWRWGLSSAGIQAVVIAFVCVIFVTGCFRSAQRFLDNGSVEEATITYVGAPALLYEEASGSSTGTGYYIMSEVTVTQADAIQQVKDLQEMFIASGRQELAASNVTSETVIPYDVCFSYTDDSGKVHTWYYDRASLAQLEAMLSIEGYEEVQTGQLALLTGDTDEGESIIWAYRAYENGSVFLTDPYLSYTYQLTMTEEDREDLLSAVAEDISQMSLEERYFPGETAEAVLMFTLNGVSDCDYFTYHLDNAFLYITPAYTHTLAWLEGQGLLELVQQEPEIEYIYLQKFDPYIGMNAISYPMGLYFMAYCADTGDEFLIQKDFGTKYTITDPERIAQLTTVLQDGYYMSQGGWLAAVKIAGQDRYRYMFLPAADAPDFIRG